MASKNHPGAYDCYTNAHPDEPMFVLLGRDPTAALLVRLWSTLRDELGGTEPEALEEALTCAAAMEAWAAKLGKEAKIACAKYVFLERVVPAVTRRLAKRDPLLHIGDAVRHKESGRVGTVTGFAHDGSIDVMIDRTGPYKQDDFVRLVPESG